MMGTTRKVLLIAVTALLVAVAVTATGCATKSKTTTGMEVKPDSAKQASAMPAGMKVDPDAQNCAACTKGETAAPVAGTVEMVDGKQMLNVTIQDGTYVPNRFTANASAPVVMKFTVEGKPATACISKPTVKQLDKMMPITSGTDSMDLGTLDPGTYDFTCGMGRPIGQIVVQ